MRYLGAIARTRDYLQGDMAANIRWGPSTGKTMLKGAFQ